MASAAFSDYDGIAHHDHRVVLRRATWEDYERLLAMRGDHSAPRYTYLEGELEITSPSRSHEAIKSLIGCLIEVWCLERNIEFETLGSWTLKDRAVQRGIEPDECYVFGAKRDATGPDLAIEVIWTHGGIDKLEVYRKLGVAEVWTWSKGTIQVHVLNTELSTDVNTDHYEQSAESRVLPGLDHAELATFLDQPTTSAAIRAYRARLQGR